MEKNIFPWQSNVALLYQVVLLLLGECRVQCVLLEHYCGKLKANRSDHAVRSRVVGIIFRKAFHYFYFPVFSHLFCQPLFQSRFAFTARMFMQNGNRVSRKGYNMSDFMTKCSSIESLLRKRICPNIFIRFVTDDPIVVSKSISFLTENIRHT